MARKPAPQRTAPADPRRHVLGEAFSDPDLVDRIFEYILEITPALAEAAEQLAEKKRAVREEFAGEKVYVRTHHERRRADLVAEVLRIFNGRNATEVARRLQISRATVYRIIKQPGQAR